MIEGDCTTLVNPLNGDAKAFLLDRWFLLHRGYHVGDFVTLAGRSYNSFDPQSEAYIRNDKIFEDTGPAIASSIKNENNVSPARCAAALHLVCASANMQSTFSFPTHLLAGQCVCHGLSGHRQNAHPRGHAG